MRASIFAAALLFSMPVHAQLYSTDQHDIYRPYPSPYSEPSYNNHDRAMPSFVPYDRGLMPGLTSQGYAAPSPDQTLGGHFVPLGR